MKKPFHVYQSALKIDTRILKLEHIILTSSEYAFWYSKNIVKGRWLEAEPAIAKNAQYANSYSISIIKDRWLEAETTIAQDAVWSQHYMKHWFKNERVFKKSEVSEFAWLNSGAQGYFAPAKLFEKISTLDTFIE